MTGYHWLYTAGYVGYAVLHRLHRLHSTIPLATRATQYITIGSTRATVLHMLHSTLPLATQATQYITIGYTGYRADSEEERSRLGRLGSILHGPAVLEPI